MDKNNYRDKIVEENLLSSIQKVFKNLKEIRILKYVSILT